MKNDEKYIRGYSITRYKSKGTIAIRLMFTDGTWDDTNFVVFTEDEKINFKSLGIIGHSKKDAKEWVTLQRRALAGVEI